MPIITLCFLAYALAGPQLPPPWTHKGYEVGRLVGVMYMTLEGIYGVAIDVSSSLIILFTIFGAFLQYSGAGKFYIDFSFAAMGGKPTGAGRTRVASFCGRDVGLGVADGHARRRATRCSPRSDYERTPPAACSRPAAGRHLSRGAGARISDRRVLTTPTRRVRWR